jgi:hypothetical protein
MVPGASWEAQGQAFWNNKCPWGPWGVFVVIEAWLRREEEVSIMRELVEGLENSVVVLMVEL